MFDYTLGIHRLSIYMLNHIYLSAEKRKNLFLFIYYHNFAYHFKFLLLIAISIVSSVLFILNQWFGIRIDWVCRSQRAKFVINKAKLLLSVSVEHIMRYGPFHGDDAKFWELTGQKSNTCLTQKTFLIG